MSVPRNPPAINVQEPAGGNYHFGINEGILSKLATNPGVASMEQLTLQVNIDGLPLYKSATDQFWPILYLLQEDETKEPFIVACLWENQSRKMSIHTCSNLLMR